MQIETKRLQTRKLVKGDASIWLEFLQDENSIEFLSFVDNSMASAEFWVERQLNRYASDGLGLMWLIEKSTGSYIGQCGLMKQEVEGNEEWEIGYHIMPQYRGKGYATEAAIAFKEYAFENEIADSLVSIIHERNNNSQAVAERNGMKRDFLTRSFKLMEGVPHYIYRVRRNDKFENSYADNFRAESYSKLEFPNTYYLAYRDLPQIIKLHTSCGTAIDFGCGTGRSTRFLKSLGFDTVGVDISEEMLKIARKEDDKGYYQLVKDGSVGDFTSNSMNLVLSVFTFDNLPGIEKRQNILEEMARVLKDEGKIIMLDSNPELYVNDWASFTTSIFPTNKLAGSGDIVKVQMEDVDDKRPVEDVIWFDSDYCDLFEKSNLEIEKIYRPLANEEEPFNWINETQIAPWIIYVVRKKPVQMYFPLM